MSTPDNIEEALQLLQDLGLKEYEARCFVGLTRLNTGTAKELSELTEVPRTRVYDAIRVLESKGLVEIHHSSPQRFRAVSLQEAAETLRDRYADRVDRLQNTLEPVEGAAEEEDGATVQQVWAMSGGEAIENRTEELIKAAEDEVVLILCDDSVVTDDLVATLNRIGNGADLLIGVMGESMQQRLQDDVPAATTFISGLEWLQGVSPHEDDTKIGRLLLVDRSEILVSSIQPGTNKEQAIFGEGFTNGLVVVARRLMAQGLLEPRDPRA